MFDRIVSASDAHQHTRFEVARVPIPQPHRTEAWRCQCGAMELDTYPIGPQGADHSVPPIGRAWVGAEQIRRAIQNHGRCGSERGSAGS